jgi:hypothetical protein
MQAPRHGVERCRAPRRVDQRIPRVCSMASKTVDSPPAGDAASPHVDVPRSPIAGSRRRQGLAASDSVHRFCGQLCGPSRGSARQAAPTLDVKRCAAGLGRCGAISSDAGIRLMKALFAQSGWRPAPRPDARPARARNCALDSAASGARRAHGNVEQSHRQGRWTTPQEDVAEAGIDTRGHHGASSTTPDQAADSSEACAGVRRRECSKGVSWLGATRSSRARSRSSTTH